MDKWSCMNLLLTLNNYQQSESPSEYWNSVTFTHIALSPGLSISEVVEPSCKPPDLIQNHEDFVAFGVPCLSWKYPMWRFERGFVLCSRTAWGSKTGWILHSLYRWPRILRHPRKRAKAIHSWGLFPTSMHWLYRSGESQRPSSRIQRSEDVSQVLASSARCGKEFACDSIRGMQQLKWKVPHKSRPKH